MALSDVEVEELETILGCLEECRTKLNKRSLDFVDQQIERFKQYNTDIRLSVAQWEWLRNLYSEHCT